MQIIVEAVTKFYSMLLIGGFTEAGLSSVVLHADGERLTAQLSIGADGGNGFAAFTAQFLMPRPEIDDRWEVAFWSASPHKTAIGDLVKEAQQRAAAPSLMSKFSAEMQKLAANGPVKVLDIGGRARSGGLLADQYRGWDVTVLDIVADAGVDVVADAHEMSSALDAESFDGAFSVSVFEHLLMPWKVAVELSKVLKIGGLAMIHTHQTIGMHDMPWDFYRYSDSAWDGIFNAATGFEVVERQVAEYMQIIPRIYDQKFRDAEKAGGWLTSGVLVRKIGAARVDWDVDLGEVLATAYPMHPETAGQTSTT